MGSTGSGRFTDYSGTGSTSSGGANGSGGTSGTDRCKIAFSVTLEEVALCEYFSKTGTLPATGTQLKIVLDKRLFAVDSSNTKVGALPTSFNYLAACLATGHSYIGLVSHSTATPIPSVVVDFAAI